MVDYSKLAGRFKLELAEKIGENFLFLFRRGNYSTIFCRERGEGAVVEVVNHVLGEGPLPAGCRSYLTCTR